MHEIHCDFCETALPNEEPANLALIAHIQENQECNEQFNFMLDNLRSSWTRHMSGG